MSADMLVAIATDNTWAHAYPDVRAATRDARANAAYGRTAEFFDATGRRLLPVAGRTGHVAELRATAEAPAPEAVTRRLAEVLDYASGYLRQHPELVAGTGQTPDTVIARLPQLTGRNLPDQFAMFSHLAGVHPLPRKWWHPRTVVHADPGGWFHNAMHAAGWNH